jgi:SAM-dependent methyltransferase
MKEAWNSSAENYYSDVISPLKDSVYNPLFEDIKKYSSKKNVVADMGCGIGELLPLLSKNFKEVHAWDYSEKMIEKCLSNKKENVHCKVKDITKVNEKNVFDLVISVNSILEPDTKIIDRTFKNIYGTIKKKGIFIGVLPAIESYIYQAMLGAEELNDPIKFKEMKRQFLKEISIIKGCVKLGDETQKAFYRFEILHRMKKAGFKKIEINKVYYSWKAWKDAGQLYFPNESPPWDWYVKAEK